MSQGNLERKVVALDFWPACGNCVRHTTCQTQPKHEAYPHTWQWGADRAVFPTGMLILTSWVGNSVIGQAHTGCHDYTVHPAHTQALDARHLEYLNLEGEKVRCEAIFTRLERKERWTAEDDALFATTLCQYKAVLADQATLRSTTADTLPVAVNA